MSDTTSPERAPNALIGEKSPYLLQHARNPVDWHPWGAAALELARRDDRPIFLSVGYAACHWCHVMERESFENEETARLLNAHFVCVKVDREERPDIDEIYMTAVQRMTGHGGWPMSVFLTPDGRPFYGGTYFPPESRHGRIGFPSLVTQLADAWRSRRAEVEQVADTIAEDLESATRQRPLSGASGPVVPETLLADAVTDLEGRFDPECGGFGGAPKFPPHHALRLLCMALRRGDERALPMLHTTLDRMAQGGIYDHVGGGFHRYATDRIWLLPHFEKMLTDNALLARVYADAYALTGREAWARIARETCDWVLRDMTEPDGGFVAAFDADSEGEEGRYYVWTRAEAEAVAGAAFCDHYRIVDGGNYRDEATRERTGACIPHLGTGPDASPLPAALDPDTEAARARLREARSRRVPPLRDGKILTNGNGLMIGALARTGQTLGEARYIDAAIRAARFCRSALCPDGILLHRWAGGEAAIPAFLDDHAYLADGLLDLADATGDDLWRQEARALADTLLAHFWDTEDGGFFFASPDRHEALIARSKDLFDGALPSANGVAVRVLARLGGSHQEKAREMLHTYQGVLTRAPQGMATLISAAAKAFPDPAPSQPGASAADDPVVAFEAEAPLLRMAPGTTALARFGLTLADGWHIHARRPNREHLIATIVSLDSDLPAALGPVTYPVPVERSVAGDRLLVYEGGLSFEVPIALEVDAPAGEYRLDVTLRCQPCASDRCLAPREVAARARVVVASDT